MESLISKLVAEHFLLYFENLLIKQNTDIGSFLCHTVYIGNINYLWPQKVTNLQVWNTCNSVPNKLKFTLAQEIGYNTCF